MQRKRSRWRSAAVLALVLLSGLVGAEAALAGRVRRNHAPDGVIDTPASGLVVAVGDSVALSGTGSDSDGNLPLQYQWIFPPGSGVPGSTLEDPGPVTFSQPGQFQVTFQVTDARGRPDATPASLWIVVRPAPQIVDNGGPGFSALGVWPADTQPSGFFGNDFQATYGGSGSATWSFVISEAGEYALSASWPRDMASYASSAASYTLVHSGTPIATLALDQTTAGGRFNRLARLALQPGTLEVVLHASSSAWVAADAIQLDRVSLAIASPAYLAVETSGNVSVAADLLGVPSAWGVEFVLDDGPAATEDLVPPYVFEATSLAMGEHRVDAFLIDEAGRRVPGVATDLRFGRGDYYLAFGDSMTRGYGDQISADDTSSDGRNHQSGFEPILNDLLSAARGYPHTVESDGQDGRRSDQGLADLPALLAAHPGANALLVQFGTNDAFWTQTPSGLGLVSGNPGYDGSYKDSMRRLAAAVVAAGRQVLLARPPPFVGNYGSSTPLAVLNGLVDEYVQVLAEIEAELGLPAGPDFHAHFAAAPGEYYDDCHPDGVGYQAMATLWRDALLAAP